MGDWLIPPGFILMGGALLVFLLPGRLRKIALIATTLLAGWMLFRLEPGSELSVGVAGYTLHFLHVDALSRVFAIVLVGITFIGSVYALHLDGAGQHVAALLYAGGSLGVVFAGDWLTLFVFWELMAVSSVFLVWFRKEPAAMRAGQRYFLVHTAGGGLLLTGILLHLAGGGGTEIGVLTGGNDLAFWFILLGVGLNAAIPPLHPWLPDAYAEGTVTGSVFMSAFTTKTAIYVLLRVFPGTSILLPAGVIMALYGVVFAVLENDIRRLLAYHIVSQVGYMVAGVGMGTQLAVDGAAAHAFCHILYKSLLFMGAGAVVYATGLRKLTELGGIARKMPLVLVLYGVGAVSISGFPLFNGFVSKSMVISAAADGGWPLAELMLTLASIGTFLHTGLKLLYFTFLGPDHGVEVKPVPVNMKIAMGLGAAGCLFFGLPSAWKWFGHDLLYGWLPFAEVAEHFHPYTVDHVVHMGQLLVGTFLMFLLLIRKLGGEATITLDTDWFYRRWVPRLVTGSLEALDRLSKTANEIAYAFRDMFFQATRNPIRRSKLLSRVAADTAEPEEVLPGYDENADRLPISLTVGGALLVMGLVALVDWLGS